MFIQLEGKKNGNVYDVRFEGYEDKNEFDDSNPKKIGRKLELYLDGDELINYKGIMMRLKRLELQLQR